MKTGKKFALGAIAFTELVTTLACTGIPSSPQYGGEKPTVPTPYSTPISEKIENTTAEIFLLKPEIQLTQTEIQKLQYNPEAAKKLWSLVITDVTNLNYSVPNIKYIGIIPDPESLFVSTTGSSLYVSGEGIPSYNTRVPEDDFMISVNFEFGKKVFQKFYQKCG